jgi:hypothetical protein
MERGLVSKSGAGDAEFVFLGSRIETYELRDFGECYDKYLL